MQEELFKLQDLNYKNFTSKLIPNINKDVIIEFMGPSSLVYLYDLNRNEKILKVGSLTFNIY